MHYSIQKVLGTKHVKKNALQYTKGVRDQTCEEESGEMSKNSNDTSSNEERGQIPPLKPPLYI